MCKEKDFLERVVMTQLDSEPWRLRGLIEAKYRFISLRSASRSGFEPQLAIRICIPICKVSSKVRTVATNVHN
jgi:hypothetical protein